MTKHLCLLGFHRWLSGSTVHRRTSAVRLAVGRTTSVVDEVNRRPKRKRPEDVLFTVNAPRMQGWVGDMNGLANKTCSSHPSPRVSFTEPAMGPVCLQRILRGVIDKVGMDELRAMNLAERWAYAEREELEGKKGQ